MTCIHPGGCRRPIKGHGYCRTHLDRVRKTGDPGPAQIEKRASRNRPCVISECDRIVGLDGGRDMCGTHYQRLLKHGDPTVVGIGGASLSGADNPNWSADAATYSAVHLRLRRQRGQAATYACVDCGGRAREWSYDNAASIELSDPRLGRYTPDLDHYDPRCTSCHRLFDNSARALLTQERP